MEARVSRHVQRWRESGMLVLLVLLLLAVFVVPNLIHLARNARMVDDVLQKGAVLVYAAYSTAGIA